MRSVLGVHQQQDVRARWMQAQAESGNGHALPRAVIPHPASEFSIVLPLYNEEPNIPAMYTRLTTVMESLGEAYEVIFVDDGSVDGSAEMIRALHQRDARIKLVRLGRNFGHQVAISAGLDAACGQAVAIMDADLQDPPEALPAFIAKWREGYDVVYAIRQKRQESGLKRAAYHVFYRLLKRLAAIDIPLDSGDFCVMDRRVVDLLATMPERNRFVRGIRAWVGLQQVGLPCARGCRQAGEPKYTLGKLLRLAADGLVSFSYVPLRLASLFGFVISAVAFALALWTIYQKIIHPNFIAGFTTIVVAVSLLGGIQLLTLGIVGEYIGRIFDEVKQRPLYTIREVVGFDGES